MSDTIRVPMQGARSEGLCAVWPIGAQGQISIRCEHSADFRETLRGAIGLEVPAPLGSAQGETGALLWMAQDELLLLCPYDKVAETMAELTKVFDGWFIAITDVSDARAFIAVKGPQLRDVLAKLTPADMAAHALTPGTIRRTRLAQVAAGIWLQSETTAQVFCFRSVAEYAFKALTLAAEPGGEVGFHIAQPV
ncbi:sarcosine oxidase subunit gamma family protein [Salipiger sp. 1_MG-2023]|uniref:sarcosine oxidase subunit gamma n=1 Tax=Salipiger sp. 1_MG-2023 TaxID=3062665 RepID=UPI0026E3D233|nr:sarcosine oxidase subunit gamma family protein [Salipiger sp. 1_MG-2023]MDO6583893.1 sarcosine oxidase subunit gamma family protein [Salipiger sp. 1_MG-2023]